MGKKKKLLLLSLVIIVLSSSLAQSSVFSSKLELFNPFYLKVKTRGNSIFFDERSSFTGNSLLIAQIIQYSEFQDEFDIVINLVETGNFGVNKISFDSAVNVFTSRNFSIMNITLIPITDAFFQILETQEYMIEDNLYSTIIRKEGYYFRYNSKGLLQEYKEDIGDSKITISRAIPPVTFSSLFTLLPLLALLGFSIFILLRRRKQEKVVSVLTMKSEKEHDILFYAIFAIVLLLFTIENQSFSNIAFLGKLGFHNLVRGSMAYADYLIFSSIRTYEIPFSSSLFLFIFLALISFSKFRQKRDDKRKFKFILSSFASLSALTVFLLFICSKEIFYYEGKTFIYLFLIVFETLTNVFIFLYLIVSNKQRISKQTKNIKHKNKKVLFSGLAFTSLSGITSALLVIIRELNNRFLNLEIRPLTVILEGIHFSARFFNIIVIVLIFLYLVRLIINEKKRNKNKSTNSFPNSLLYVLLASVATQLIISYIFNLNLNWRGETHLYISQYILSFFYFICYSLIYFIIFSVLLSSLEAKKGNNQENQESNVKRLEGRYDSYYAKDSIAIITCSLIAILFFVFKNDQLVRIGFERNHEYFAAKTWYQIDFWFLGYPLLNGKTATIFLTLIILIGIFLLSSKNNDNTIAKSRSSLKYIYTLIILFFSSYVLNGFIFMKRVGWNQENILWFVYSVITVDVISGGLILFIIVKLWKKHKNSYFLQKNKILPMSVIFALSLTLFVALLGFGINTIAMLEGQEQIASRLFKTGVLCAQFISLSVLIGCVVTALKMVNKNESNKFQLAKKIFSISLVFLLFAAKTLNIVIVFLKDTIFFDPMSFEQLLKMITAINYLEEFCRLLFILVLLKIGYSFLKMKKINVISLDN